MKIMRDCDTKIKKINAEKIEEALRLVLEVFMQYEAPDYSAKGIETFTNFLKDREKIYALELYGAYQDDRLVGVIATRNNGNHIALFFVDGKYHRQGIGKKLFEEVAKHSTGSIITVNSSPYAVEVYERLGFTANETEQLTDGIRYTPMSYRK